MSQVANGPRVTVTNRRRHRRSIQAQVSASMPAYRMHSNEHIMFYFGFRFLAIEC